MLVLIEEETPVVEGSGGGGGKGGGSPRTPQEAANSLHSRQTVRVVEVLSEGEIGGLVNGAQGIFFNGTPLQNPDGSYNFANVIWDSRNGLPDQTYLPGFPAAENVVAITTQVTTATPLTYDVSDDESDAARIIIQLPQGLENQVTSGDNIGDINGSNVTIAIDTRLTGGTYANAITDTINGKTNSAYERAYRVARPSGEGSWQIRVRRITADSSTSTLINRTDVAAITEIDDIKLPYEDTAVVGIAIDAQSVGNQIPARGYLIYGIKVKVPTNYNPTTRIYMGNWDGTFKTAWTNNTAWIIYDLLTNTRYGMGDYIDTTQIDKFSFYEAAVYNDELVDDGDGGTEPRYTFNAPIALRDDCWKVLNNIASNCRSVVLYGPGTVTLLQDRPSDPVKIIGNQNVIDGVFDYSSSGFNARHTSINVTFNDSSNNKYLPRTVSEEDLDGVERYGFNSEDIVAVGCTSEGQARRLARWILYTELNQTEMVKFSVSWQNADLTPGDVITLMDNNRAGGYYTGRIAGGTTTGLDLDREITLLPGAVYTISMMGNDGVTIQTKTISSASGAHTSITLSTALPVAPTPGVMWVISSEDDVVPRQFRVLGMSEKERNIFDVIALSYAPDKYAHVEDGVALATPVFSTVVEDTVSAVTGVAAKTENYSDPVQGPRINIHVYWTPPTEKFVTSYKVRWQKDSGAISSTSEVDQPDFILPGVAPGEYNFFITPINLRGVQGPTTNFTYTYSIDGNNDLDPPTDLALKSGTGLANEFYTQDLFVQWVAPTTIVAGQTIGGYLIKVYDNDTATLVKSDEVGPLVTSYQYDYQENLSDGGPFRSLEVNVYSLDVMNRPSSDPVTQVFTNNAPSVPGTITFLPRASTVAITTSDPSPASDAAGMVVWLSTENGFVADDSNKAFVGDVFNTTIAIADNTTYYAKVAWYDTYGTTDLNKSSQFTFTSDLSSDTAKEILTTLQNSLTSPADISDGNFIIDAERMGIVLRPKLSVNDVSSQLTVSDNSVIGGISTAWATGFGTRPIPNGKYYWEVTLGYTPTGGTSTGVILGMGLITESTSTWLGSTATGFGYEVQGPGGTSRKLNNNSGANYGATAVSGDVIGVAVDMASGTIEFFKNGSSQGVAYSSGIVGKVLYPAYSILDVNTILQFNFGREEFAYTVPSGYTDMFSDESALAFPFAIGSIGGHETIALQGDVIINGKVSVANLKSGSLPTDTSISIGGGVLVLRGDGNIFSYASTSPTADYCQINSGIVTNFVYVPALSAYVPYKNLTRLEIGTVANGATVVIPGYWKQQPVVQVVPASCKLYDAGFSGQSQTLVCQATALTDLGNGQWSFVPKINLQLAANVGTTVISSDSGTITGNWTSGTQTTAANTSQITPHIKVNTYRGTGTSGQYYNRQYRWSIDYFQASAWVAGAFTAWKNFGATTSGFVLDSMAFNFPSAAAWQWRVNVQFQDKDGTTFGSPAFNTAFDVINCLTTTTQTICSSSASGNSGPANHDADSVSTGLGAAQFPAYTPPAGWTITAVDYSIIGSIGFNVGTYNAGGFAEGNMNGGWGVYNNTLDTLTYQSISAKTLPSRSNITKTYHYVGSAWTTSPVNASTSCTSVNLQNSCSAAVWISAGSKATVTRTQPVAASSTAQNDAILDTVDFSLSQAQILATGTCTYTATGA